MLFGRHGGWHEGGEYVAVGIGQAIHTLWGDLAWQLGKAEGYALVADADRSGTSPGKNVLQELLSRYVPCVILIDELVAYIRQFEEGKALMKRGTVDLSLLDEKVESLCAKILLTFPDCTTKTLEELRKPKLEAWNRNKEDARAWLALNMMTEARSGFTAFNEGTKEDREVDFVLLRQKLAAGQSWVGPLHDEIQPRAKR